MAEFSQSDLRSIASDCALKIKNSEAGESYFSEPYQHMVIDDFFPTALAESCLRAFPPLSDSSWEHQNDADIEVKYRSNWESELDIPDGLVHAVRILNSSLLLRAMSARLKIEKIVPDPYFTGGGLNVTTRGGLLDVHVDGNYHDATGLNRRLNAILYLNRGWTAEWGGEFGVYDATGLNCVKKVAPLFNRLVVFDSHDYSFHGLPDPVNFPEDEQRRSIILYYYTKAPRPSNHVAVEEPHSALWVKRGLKDKRGNVTRKFK